MSFYRCPFCPFADDNADILVQHVGLVHPETDTSPFLAKNTPEQERKSMERVREGVGPRDAPSEDGFIECECGETVLLSEFSSHSDLHLAEGMASEEAEKADLSSDTTILSRYQSPYPDTGTFTRQSSANATSSTNNQLSPASTSTSRPRGTVQKHSYTIKDWANVLLGTNPPPRPKTTKAKRRSARRLGVRRS